MKNSVAYKKREACTRFLQNIQLLLLIFFFIFFSLLVQILLPWLIRAFSKLYKTRGRPRIFRFLFSKFCKQNKCFAVSVFYSFAAVLFATKSNFWIKVGSVGRTRIHQVSAEVEHLELLVVSPLQSNFQCLFSFFLSSVFVWIL